MLIKPLLLGDPPGAQPLSLDEAKAQLDLQGIGDFDLQIGALIAAATGYVEKYTGRALITRRYHGFLDHWPRRDRMSHDRWDMGGDGVWSDPGHHLLKREIEIPMPPLISVESLTVYDDDDVATVVDPAIYFTDTGSTVGRIVLRRCETWPCASRTANAIEVAWTCGYGEAGADVDEPIRHAMLLLVSHWFQNRDAVVGVDNRDSSTQLPLGVPELLAPFCVITF